MKKLFFACTASVALLTGCETTETANPNPTYKGVEQTLGNGKAYTWVKFVGDKPTALGVTFTKGALDNLPHNGGLDRILPVPTEAMGKTPFDHLFLNFLHTGHEPVGTYDLGHFDLHFMMQPSAERAAIPDYTPTSAAKFDNLPPAGIMPVPYIRLPAGVAQNGVHWLDPTSPELGGKKFTSTLILGSYDGKMNFVEPMVTLEFLQSKPNFTKPVPTPAKFAKAGYFPMAYSVKQVGDDVEVSLDNLMLMQ